MIEQIMFFACVATITLVIILTRFVLKWQELKYKHQTGSNENASEIKQQLGHVMAENEEMKEELRNIKYLLSQDKRFIDIEAYEQEQIRIDRENKMNL